MNDSYYALLDWNKIKNILLLIQIMPVWRNYTHFTKRTIISMNILWIELFPIREMKIIWDKVITDFKEAQNLILVEIRLSVRIKYFNKYTFIYRVSYSFWKVYMINKVQSLTYILLWTIFVYLILIQYLYIILFISRKIK